MTESELKGLAIAGGFTGAFVGLAIAGSGSGMGGLAVVGFCAMIGALTFSCVLPLLGLACVGIYSLYKKCRSKDDSAEPAPKLSKSPEHAQTQERRSSLSTTIISQSIPKPSPTESLEVKSDASPRPTIDRPKSAAPQNTSLMSRFCSFISSWSKPKLTNAASTQTEHLAPANRG